MVWGCMGWNGVGRLIEVEGKMDAAKYCEILEDGLVESFKTLEMEEGEHYFQQDNDPKHTSKKANKWFEDNDIQVISWLAQSSDLNPIEHLWEHLKCQLHQYETPPKEVHELVRSRITFHQNMSEPHKKYAKEDSSSYKGKRWSYQVLDSKIINV